MRQVEVIKSARWSFARFCGLPLLAVLALGVLCERPSVVCAEEATPSEPTDKLMIRGGWAYVFGATADVSVGGPVLGLSLIHI